MALAGKEPGGLRGRDSGSVLEDRQDRCTKPVIILVTGQRVQGYGVVKPCGIFLEQQSIQEGKRTQWEDIEGDNGRARRGGDGEGWALTHQPGSWTLSYTWDNVSKFSEKIGVKSSLAVVRWVGGRKKVRGTNPADRAFDARWTDRRMILGSDDDRDEGERIHSKDIPGNSLAVRWFGLCSLLRAWVQSLFRN